MKARLGGLARRGTYIEQLKSTAIPLIHLDAGDAFQATYQVNEASKAQVRAAAEIYLNTFQTMGLQAYTVGDRDLALGIPLLKELAEKAAFPFLSANIQDEENAHVFEPSVLLEAGGLKIAVIGATTTLFVNKQQVTSEYKIQLNDPAEAVAAQVARWKAQGVELFVVLAHLNEGEVEKVAQRNPEVQLVLGGQSLRKQATLERSETAWVANAYMRGKNLSVLSLFVRDGSLTFVDPNNQQALQRQQAQLEQQIAAQQRFLESARTEATRASSIPHLERRLVQLRTELQQVGFALEDVEEIDPNASHVAWELKGMTTEYSDHTEIAAKVQAYRAEFPDPAAARRRATPPNRLGPAGRPLPPTGARAAPPSRNAAPVAPTAPRPAPARPTTR